MGSWSIKNVLNKINGALFSLMFMGGCATTDINIRSVVPPQQVPETRKNFSDLEEHFIKTAGTGKALYEDDLYAKFPFLKIPEEIVLNLENKLPEKSPTPIEVYKGDKALAIWLEGRPAFLDLKDQKEIIGYTDILKTDVVYLVVKICPLNVIVKHDQGGIKDYFKGMKGAFTGHAGGFMLAFKLEPETSKRKLIGIREIYIPPTSTVEREANLWYRTMNGLADTLSGAARSAVNVFVPR